jgi:hypothetical protein
MDTLGIAGDIASAGTALAGLLLVFMGSIATSFDTYEKTEKRTVLSRYRYRIWFAFLGLLLSLIAAVISLIAKANGWGFGAWVAFWALLVGFVFAIAAAIRAALDVK